jgi:hypothetical protein
MLMMRMLAQLLAAVVLTWKCIAPVDTVRGAGRPREARVQAPSTRSFKRGTQPCCVEAVPGERKMNIFCLSARKILLTLSGFACRYWSSPAGFSTMWAVRLRETERARLRPRRPCALPAAALALGLARVAHNFRGKNQTTINLKWNYNEQSIVSDARVEASA